ncbi:nucleosome assembly protein 1-like 1 isoform X2 [Tubulanus polymorphus]|uniref:nucleosome assembly protein 1-like 1 isoform X2 n=1 Tax=Tubulanus polymorphus TaxID=672921 RepID=UPI003DA4FFEC
MADQNKAETDAKTADDSTKDVESGEIIVSAGDGAITANDLAGRFMRDPNVLNAIQGRLQGLVGLSGGYIQSLPKPVKRRVKALKKMQFETMKLEAQFYEEVHQLECKYAALYDPYFLKRKEVVTGAVEPTDSDCDWPSDEEEEDEDELAEEMKTKAAIEDEGEGDKKKEEESEEKKEEENPNGIPYFWLTVFNNVEMLADMVQEHDRPIINHLQDIRVKHQDKEPIGFTLEFVFSANDYFTNKILTKQYTLRVGPDDDDPFIYEGPEIIKCTGCTIDWKKGKNVTKKTVKKTQKHKNKGTIRQVTKQVQNDSFFNFFNPPTAPEGGDEDEELDEETETLLAADFEIGHFIRERIVPRAVLYFTGEALEDDDDEYDDEEDDGDDEDEDEDQDPDYVPAPTEGNPGECKNQ